VKDTIRNVIKSEKGMVLVFNQNGEQIPKYQGQYEEVRETILRKAPLDAVFSHASTVIQDIPREKW
jgi:hypothetical protein